MEHSSANSLSIIAARLGVKADCTTCFAALLPSGPSVRCLMVMDPRLDSASVQYIAVDDGQSVQFQR